MAQKANSHEKPTAKSKERQSGLPVPIHPDDAKDKVFTAILKALLKMGNKPSSPKELANIIVKHKYATLGGATPFATVSSRISQHFKRAAEHNPPRAPLLAKHVDQNHSRKINYSLATESVSNSGSGETNNKENIKKKEEEKEEDDEDDEDEITHTSIHVQDPTRTNSKTRRTPLPLQSPSLKRKGLKSQNDLSDDEDDGQDADEEDTDEEDNHQIKKLKSEHQYSSNLPISPLITPSSPSSPIHPNQQLPSDQTSPSLIVTTDSPHNENQDSDEDSGSEHSDYHEEMLKGDDLNLSLNSLSGKKMNRRKSSIRFGFDKKSCSKKNNTHDLSSDNNPPINTTITHHPTASHPASSPVSPTKDNTNPPQDNANRTNSQPNTASTSASTSTSSKLLVPPQEASAVRKPSFSFSSGFPGEQEFWTPFSFEHDFDNVFLQDASTAHNIPFNIATPESISVSELDNYFGNPTSSTSHLQRKSFSSTMLCPDDKSLLQKVLLASAARGVADKIEDESQKGKSETTEEQEIEGKPQDNTKPVEASHDVSEVKTESIESTTSAAPSPTPKPNTSTSKPAETLSSSSLMDMTDGEDFVKFEEDEKKESPTAPAGPSTALPTTSPQLAQPLAPKKMTEILPAAPTTVSAAEILKSMNIQNLNLSALQQVTNTIPSLQHLSPTFDLAKTMAAYMQSLAKSASNASPASSTHAMDLKSILTRFPVLEAFIKKDSAAAASVGVTPSPPLTSSPTVDFVPNLVSTTNTTPTPPSFTAGSTEPIVHTLTTMNPPMYITLIDHVAVCIVVLEKTESTPEYRIMRRVDTGFINGTVLLTAGGIETESERSMILSFEMERVRMPKKKSPLFGTWIPLRRAQELAVTCSIQHKLGHFLEDSIEPYFPSPLPIQITPRKPTRDSRLAAIALAALRSENAAKNNEFIVPPISRQSSSSGTIAAAQLQELLMTHPHKALKSNGFLNEKGTLLSKYDDKDELPTLQPTATRKNSIQSQQSSSSQRNNSTSAHTSSSDKEESDVDIVNSSDSSAGFSNEEDSDHETVHSTDTQSNSLNLEDILGRVTSKQPLHIHPRELQKKRRRSSQDKKPEVESNSQESSIKANKAQPPRKKSGGTTGGGKWSSISKPSTNATVAIKRSASGSGATITIKRPGTANNAQAKKNGSSASSSSHSAAPNSTKQSAKQKDEEMDEEIDNVVVEHKTIPSNTDPKPEISSQTPTTPTDVKKEDTIDEDDEDEDIDIGGSDFDDDLR